MPCPPWSAMLKSSQISPNVYRINPVLDFHFAYSYVNYDLLILAKGEDHGYTSTGTEVELRIIVNDDTNMSCWRRTGSFFDGALFNSPHLANGEDS